MSNRVFVAGGAGFIGSHFIELLLESGMQILNFDNLSYAANLNWLNTIESKNNYTFIEGDITNFEAVFETYMHFKPNFVVNFAAESHVDNSILQPQKTVETNIVGATTLFEATRRYLETPQRDEFIKFVQVSTDEVYGSRASTYAASENSCLTPTNVYASTKASADHLAQSYFNTYSLPIVITRCCNNYGSRQNNEKYVPKIIDRLVSRKNIPIFGSGLNVRQWIHVKDHVRAILRVMQLGNEGMVYNVGDEHYLTNLELASKLCRLYDEAYGCRNHQRSETLLTHVPDRVGHDFSYSIDSSKIRDQLGWSPVIGLDRGLNDLILNANKAK